MLSGLKNRGAVPRRRVLPRLPLWLFALGLAACAGRAEPAATPAVAARVASPAATPVRNRTPDIVPTFTPTPRIRIAARPRQGTPVPTPTRQTYRIEAGDTLIDIGRAFGVSAAALQQANDIADPRTLQIGQTLVIPRATAAPAAGAATPLPYAVRGVTAYVDGLGVPWSLGEVINEHSAPVEQIRVQGVLLDAQQGEIARSQTVALRYVTPSQEAAPFMLRFALGTQEAATWLLAVSQSLPAHAGLFYTALAVDALAFDASRGAAVRVSGQLSNTGSFAATEVEVVVTLYNAQDQVVGVRVLPLAVSVLEPGSQTAFAGTVLAHTGPVTRIDAFGQGLKAD